MAVSGAAQGGVEASVHALAGALAAQISTVALYPLEQVRFLLQVEAQPRVGAGRGGEQRRWLGETAAASLQVARKQGVQALYRGIGPMLLTVSVSQGVYFWAYEGASSLLLALCLPRMLRQLVRSLAAAVVTVFLTSPMWVATVRLKLPPAKGCLCDADGPERRLGFFKGEPLKDKSSTQSVDKVVEHMRAEGWLSFLLVFRMMASIQESEGTWALWRGLGSSLWLTCVPVAQFCLYEGLRALDIWGRGVDHRPSGTEAFLLGAVAKGGAAIATYPLQVVQSNLRLRGQAFGGTLAALMRLRCERGFAGLFAGFEAKILQTALNGALMMLTYEKLLDGVAFLRT